MSSPRKKTSLRTSKNKTNRTQSHKTSRTFCSRYPAISHQNRSISSIIYTENIWGKVTKNFCTTWKKFCRSASTKTTNKNSRSTSSRRLNLLSLKNLMSSKTSRSLSKKWIRKPTTSSINTISSKTSISVTSSIWSHRSNMKICALNCSLT